MTRYTTEQLVGSKTATPAFDLMQGNDELQVLEVYPAVQGEGTLTGVPSTFVRLSGCTVGCSFCDTKYSWRSMTGTKYTVKQLYAAIKNHTTHDHVVITGGEPLEHPSELLKELIWTLVSGDEYHVTIETSGVVDVNVLFDDWYDFTNENLLLSVSPKLVSAEGNYAPPDLTNLLYHVEWKGCSAQLKYVVDPVGADNDVEILARLEEVNDHLLQHHQLLRKLPIEVILQPVTHMASSDEEVAVQVATSLRAIQEAVTKVRWGANIFRRTTKIGPRLSIRPQLHAMLYGNKRGI